jgi:small subunit ribosomal protein S15
LLIENIYYLTNHFKKNKNDKHSTRGLLFAVNRRKRLLEYLKNNKFESYKSILTKLKLRK